MTDQSAGRVAPSAIPLVIYHANCWDGFCAAWIARAYFKFSDIEPFPAHYGQPPPDCTGRVVYILDFSYKRPVMRTILAQAKKVVVIDHHKTAEAELDGLINEMQHQHGDLWSAAEWPTIVFDMNKSGARLTWEHFLPHVIGSPWLVDYTEDRDLWRHALPNSEAINAALRSYPLDFVLWDGFYQRKPESFIAEGEAIRRRERQIVEDHLRNVRYRDFSCGDQRLQHIPVVNATVLFSEIAGELAKGQPFGACYFDRQDGRRQWSLRSDSDGIDVSEIAKVHGGGGHKHAAGFEEVVA
jgi:uncharacterized protein